jgi:hypothetical protein
MSIKQKYIYRSSTPHYKPTKQHQKAVGEIYKAGRSHLKGNRRITEIRVKK